nr:acetolactate synthase large subunit [Desulfobulbaceae bacterium]
MKASDLLVKCLEEEGIEYVFGVPGEENADLMISLEQSKKIRFILTRHEQGAAFMAEAHGRLTGNPAVCLGTLGPGATNLITGVANANMDRAPMLVITGQGASHRRHKESHQVMDVVAMFRPVTKWNTTILHPDTIPEIVRKAVRLSRTEKAGACHIELPEDVAKMQTAEQPITPVRFRRPVPDDKIIDQAFDSIKNAKRPIILAGNGCFRKKAVPKLREFCAKSKIPVINTFMAKGCLDMDDEACLFTIGLQAKDVVTCALDSADVVITIGYDMVEYHPRLWNSDKNKHIIHIDFLPAEIDSCYHPEKEVIGDIAHALWMLCERVDKSGPLSFDRAQQNAVRLEMLREFALHKNDETAPLIRPQKVLWDVRQVMGPDDIVISDVGAHKMWIARHYQCHAPNTCLIPNGFCSMGFALPAAISATLICPDKKILAICGDAGFLMNVQEMETAKRINANFVAMVWEDHSYGLIQWKQDNEFGKHTDLSFDNPDWTLLAKSFGWNSHIIENSAELYLKLKTSFEEPGPTLVIIPIDYRENAKLSSRLGNIICPI